MTEQQLLATITTHSETGFSNSKYTNSLPDALAQAGMSHASWKSFLQKANDSVQFDWTIVTIGCFFCNAHNKRVARKMMLLCEQDSESQLLLPDGITVTYKMTTEKQIVRASGGENIGAGATLETYHKLVFIRKKA
mmetsp:Transcript_3559/g.5967  ORF Transcript_3559/g.5967 Transcript_3559/m.5967 type:complete len:136 (-) Transcript_3559:320-727(-)